MQRITSTLCTLTLSLALALPAAAYTGEELLKSCTTAINVLDGRNTHPTGEEFNDSGWCAGMMDGWGSVDRLYAMLLNRESPGAFQRLALYCLPDRITVHQAVRVVLKYLQNHPEELHQPGPFLTVFAFREAYPCAPSNEPVR